MKQLIYLMFSWEVDRRISFYLTVPWRVLLFVLVVLVSFFLIYMSFICQKTKRNYKQKKKRIVKELNGAENFITYPVGA